MGLRVSDKIFEDLQRKPEEKLGSPKKICGPKTEKGLRLIFKLRICSQILLRTFLKLIFMSCEGARS